MSIRCLTHRHIRCSSMRKKSSFDVSLVSKNYEVRTEWAAANFGNNGPTFRMVLPPPNVTGKLHLGHALTIIIEDAMCRHHRIKGGIAHWLPGFDHAGIATQSVVEKELWNNRQIQRHNMSREEFTNNCKLLSEKNTSLIEDQLKQLGATLNWKNSYYTLDNRFSSAVIRAFCQLHSEKLIYRDNRLVNWCSHLQSSISDQEVDRVNISSDSFLMIPAQNGGKRSVRVGVMHRIRYPLLNSTKFVEVGTTRPETIFADVALAVNPCDTRYSNLIGKRVLHPLIQGRELPILADEAVIMDKGTGILKITPSHDYLDYEIASRHWDEILCIDPNAKNRHCFDESGRITISNFKNIDRFDGREKVIQILEELNLYCGEMSYCSGQIAVCSRTGDIIEPRLTEQWFMNTSGMYADTEKAIKDGRIKIDPIGQEQRLFDWLSNKDPWCLSRQLFWGHRIPAYKTEGSPWIIAKSLEEARKRLNTSAVIQQDNDVLDTWFSSSLVPLVTSGWMEGTLDVSKPLLNIMETGWDILGFWVARMIAMTIRLTGGQVPFPRVVLHGLIRDSNGQKMSKSLGNVIDPLDIVNGIQQSEMIERLERSFLNQNEIVSAIADIRSRFPEGIPQSGADALRFALLRHDVLASDIPLNIADLAGEGLRFCNKLWNLIAYVETVGAKSLTQKDVDSENPADLWILSRLAACLQQVDSHMEECNPHLAFSSLHTFILSNLCDVYLETTKKAIWQGDSSRISQIRSTLHRVVQPTLVQLSVFMPFISEYLYERVFGRENGAIYFDFIKTSYFSFYRNKELEKNMDFALAIVDTVRSVRQQMQLPTSMTFQGTVHCDLIDNSFLSFTPILLSLSGLNLLSVVSMNSPTLTGYIPCTITGYSALLHLEIEETQKSEFISRLRRQLTKLLERKEQFNAKAEKYEGIVQRDEKIGTMKLNVIEKNSRKGKQARAVAENAENEAKKLQRLLNEIDSEKTFKNT